MRRSELGRQKEQENDRNLKKSQDRIVSLKSSPMFELNRIFFFLLFLSFFSLSSYLQFWDEPGPEKCSVTELHLRVTFPVLVFTFLKHGK